MNTRSTLFSSNNAVFSYMPACLRLALSLLLLAAVMARPAQAQQQASNTIAYQGYLTNTDGVPANGTTTVVFSLYYDDSAGTPLWQEVQRDVLFADGVFTV